MDAGNIIVRQDVPDFQTPEREIGLADGSVRLSGHWW
jgi:hypothetical protein